MRVHLITNEARIRGSGVDTFDVLLRPEPFTIHLIGAPEGVRFFAENDPVLAIVPSPDGKSAQITATGVGTSIIHLELENPRPTLLKKLIVTVFDDPTVTVDMSFGNVRDLNQA